MNRLQIIINVLLSIGLGVLFFFHFQKEHISEKHPKLPSTPDRLAYVNVDSLLEGYNLYTRRRMEFEKVQEGFETEFESRKNRLEKEIMELQKKAQAGLLTEVQMQEEEQQLMAKQQSLMEYKDREEEKMMNSNQGITREIFGKIQEYLRVNNTGYRFVFGYSGEGGILFANDSLDITGKVLEGLNKTLKED